jgi:hypothetical protein
MARKDEESEAKLGTKKRKDCTRRICYVDWRIRLYLQPIFRRRGSTPDSTPDRDREVRAHRSNSVSSELKP